MSKSSIFSISSKSSRILSLLGPAFLIPFRVASESLKNSVYLAEICLVSFPGTETVKHISRTGAFRSSNWGLLFRLSSWFSNPSNQLSTSKMLPSGDEVGRAKCWFNAFSGLDESLIVLSKPCYKFIQRGWLAAIFRKISFSNQAKSSSAQMTRMLTLQLGWPSTWCTCCNPSRFRLPLLTALILSSCL